MGFIPALFNGSKGADWQAQQANVLNPATAQQADQTFAASQDALSKQKAFADAIAASGGVGNLASVYQQMQGVANGTGPNPAQAMLNQATGQNVAATGAAMASNRGAGANAGLLARQVGQQGANTQQQAVGQAATLQANQSLGALNNLGNIAGQQIGAQQGALSALNGAAQGEQGQILGSIQGQNNANVGNAGQANTAQSKIAAGNQQAQSGMLSSLSKGIGGFLGLAEGGMVPGAMPAAQPIPAPVMAAPAIATPMPAARALSGPASFLGRTLSGLSSPQDAAAQDPNYQAGQAIGASVVPDMQALGGKAVSALGLVGMARGGMAQRPRIMKAGGAVPGQAKVRGDSYTNDTVPAKLSPGEVVIPRSVMQSADPAMNAAKFVAAVMAQKGRMPR